LGYPSRDDERRVLENHRQSTPVDELQPAISAAQITQLQQVVRDVIVDSSIYDYLLDIVEATRESEELHVGVSTRAAISLSRAAQSLALMQGRNFVVPDDIKELAVPALSHRVISKGFLHGGQREAIEGIVRRLVDNVPVPA
jgi:MoxR-like ATPase